MKHTVSQCIKNFCPRAWLAASGGALIEFTFILPFMLILAAGVWEYGRVLETQLTVENAARAGAQFASANTTDSSLTTDTQAYVIQYLTNNLGNRFQQGSSASCTPSGTRDVCAAASGVSVTFYNSSGTSSTAITGNRVLVKVQADVAIYAAFVPGLQNPLPLYGQESMYLE